VSRTDAPSAANASAMARPIPLLAPVTTARRPSSRGGWVVYPSTPAANGWRAASAESRIVLTLGSVARARAIDSLVAW
jgi:hypothetical protein